jgi:hypothetical protein
VAEAADHTELEQHRLHIPCQLLAARAVRDLMLRRGSRLTEPSPSNRACRKRRLKAEPGTQTTAGMHLTALRWPTICSTTVPVSAR